GSLNFIENYSLLVNENREVFALSKKLADFILENKIEFLSAGLKVGEVGKRFRFSLEGSFFFALKKKKVYVDKTGEMLFLYGRDIFAESVRKAVKVKKRDVVFVCNTDGDIIGIGRSRFDGEDMRSVEKETVVVENLIDRGEYLRKEKLYSSF
ncbi:MAG TPA: hypothetical protein EYP30_00235, partial [Archaeoglobaceae archaeon]|nr:hypothetical protein [Archaeoglobaceae archaeon]